MYSVTDAAEFMLRVNRQLPAGFQILTVADMPDKTNDAAGNLTCYGMGLNRDLSAEERDAIKNFLDSESFAITKIRKGRQRRLDIRKQVKSMVISGDSSIEMVLLSEEGRAAGKPAEILKAVLHLTDEESLDMRIIKVWNKSV